MPTILDRYLLRQFAQGYLACFLTLAGLYIVFDVFANLDEFLRYADSPVKFVTVLYEYYAVRLVFFFQQFSGVLSLIAAMFTLSWIQRFNELTAIMAAGIPTSRIVRPIALAAIAASLASMYAREDVIPRWREALNRTPNDLRGETPTPAPPRYDHRTDVLLQGKLAVAKERRIDSPSFVLPPKLVGRSMVVPAAKGFYQEATDEHPAGYLLDGVSPQVAMLARPSARLPAVEGGDPVVLTAVDNKWLKPDQLFIVSQVSFDQWVAGDSWQKSSSTWDLVAGLHNPSVDYGGAARVLVHARLLQPLLDLALLFLGLPFVLNQHSANVFVSVGICVALTATFFAVTLLSHWLGSMSFIAPATAAWMPVLIFGPAAVWVSHRIWE